MCVVQKVHEKFPLIPQKIFPQNPLRKVAFWPADPHPLYLPVGGHTQQYLPEIYLRILWRTWDYEIGKNFMPTKLSAGLTYQIQDEFHQ